MSLGKESLTSIGGVVNEKRSLQAQLFENLLGP